MPQDQNNLVWIDMEMTGLEPDTDRVIEVAIVVTNAQLETVAEAPVLVVHQPDSTLDAMDNWNKSTHGRSGLIEKIKVSTLTEEMAEEQMLAFLKQHVPARISPMCGNSVCQARQARGAGRHLRVDRGTEVLPRALPQGVARPACAGRRPLVR